MANVNLNIAPYYDDFDPTKDYLRVLFRPGFPVQARELTTLQSFLQEQIERFGNGVFENGARITNAEIVISKDVYNLNFTGGSNLNFPPSTARSGAILSNIDSFANTIISNADGSVKARVVRQPAKNSKFTGSVYIKYLTAKKFPSTGSYIYATIADNPGQEREFYNTFSTNTTATLGNISAGVFYIKGAFTRVGEQSVLISNTTHTPSAQIGFTVQDSFITQNEDATLYDNAKGSSNEGAPGAHRLKQQLIFSTRAVNAQPDPNFYKVETIVDGVIQSDTTSSNPVFSELIRDTLAQRTYEESGNYSINPISLYVRDNDSDATFNLNVGKTHAYVEGYRIEKSIETDVTINKPLTTELTDRRNPIKIPFPGPVNVQINTDTSPAARALPGFSTNTGSVSPYTHANRLRLYAGNIVIGIARPYGIFGNRLYMFDVRMFQKITVQAAAFKTAVGNNNDVRSGSVRGFSYVDNVDTAADNATTITVIGANSEFRANRTVQSSVTTDTTITAVTNYNLNQVTSIRGASGNFNVNVVANTIRNNNTELVSTLDDHISTARGDTTVLQNRFSVLSNISAQSNINNQYNGSFLISDYNNREEITKTLKFSYLKIRRQDNRITSGVKYGWAANDKEVNLLYPDIYKVYKITTSADKSSHLFQDTRFQKIKIENNSNVTVEQGSVIKGVTSNTEAIVALSNTGATVQVPQAGDDQGENTVYVSRTGSGETNVLEIVYLKGNSFNANEELTITPPNKKTPPTGTIKYLLSEAAVGTDITGNYLLDNGQRSNYYDIGRLVRRDEIDQSPKDDIIVFFSYFDADPGKKLYYSVDSYSNLNFFKDDVRYYNEPQAITPKNNDTGRDLRNSFDFRLRVRSANNTDGTNTVANSPTRSPFAFNDRTFYYQDIITPITSGNVPSIFETIYNRYLGRIDAISLSSQGEFVTQQGIPSLTPKKPVNNIEGMPLGYLTIPPAVRYPEEEVDIETVDNKRYTMRDIGRLEQRIENVEYAVSLSLLESQALAEDVGTRTKHGFAVDDFSTLQGTIGDIVFDKAGKNILSKHPEFRTSIDTVNKRVIPAQDTGRFIPMKKPIAGDNLVGFDPYYYSKGYAIKQYSQIPYIEQLDATSAHRINPFATWIFDGELKLDPPKDYQVIRKNNYFLNNNGQRLPRDSDSFATIQKHDAVSEPWPASALNQVTEWSGRTSTSLGREFRRGDWFGRNRTTVEAGTVITRTNRNIALTRIEGRQPRETLTGKTVIDANDEYYIRQQRVTYTATGLAPNTEHDVFFANQKVTTGKSDDDGLQTGKFTIPANINVGTKAVELKDKDTSGNSSSATAAFTAAGHIETFNVVQDVTGVTRGATLRRGTSRSSTTFARTRRFERPNRGDPIAQTFKLPAKNTATVEEILAGTANTETEGVAFITSIDLWFGVVDTRKGMNKAIVEIREVNNGYPGGPSQVLGRSDITSVSSTAAIDGVKVKPSNSNSVNFRFNTPVKLKGNKEYCIVVLSPSDIMSVYVATIGENVVNEGQNGVHSKQPNVGGHFGSFFVSQNSTTWTANQNIDMTFRLNRAKFVTTDSKIVFQSNQIDTKPFLGDIGEYNRGYAIKTYPNSNFVQVFHPNHGMNYENARVTLSGFNRQGLNNTYFYNAISDSDINNTHVVRFPTLNSYFIQTRNVATTDGQTPVTPTDTTGTFRGFATQDIVYDNLVTNYNIIKEDTDNVNMRVKTLTTNSVNLSVNNNGGVLSLQSPLRTDDYITAEVDEFIEFETPKIVRNKLNATGTDLEVELVLQNSTDYTSPFFDLQSNIDPRVFRNLTGTFLNSTQVDGLTTGAATDVNASIESGRISEKEHAAFVTKQIDLANPANSLVVKFDADMEPSSSVIISYKLRKLGDDTPFEDISWVDLPAGQQINETNFGAFTSKTDVKPYSAEITTEQFTSFKVRLRFNTENEAQIPRVSDLRILAVI